jgi:hypothetical protein
MSAGVAGAVIVNLASLGTDGLPKGEPGSLLFRHPEYTRRWWWREFGRVSYIGGREYHEPTQLRIEFQEPSFAKNPDGSTAIDSGTGLSIVAGSKVIPYRSMLFRHSREKAWEFANRQKRAYYNNFPRTIINALVSHAMKKDVQRVGSPMLDKFWGGVDYHRKLNMATFMRRGLRWAQAEGIMWACVDAPREAGGLPYTYWVNPLDILDWEVDGDGELVWLKQFVYAQAERKTWRDKIVPRFRFRIWRRDGVQTFETDSRGGNAQTVADQTRAYSVGKVPFVPLYSIRDEDYDFPEGTPLAGDLFKAANHVYNLGSLLSEIAYKQTFSWLTIPDKHIDTLQAGLSTAFGYDASTGGKPEYISPDADQARVLMEMIRDAITQARQAIGVGRGRGEESQQQASGDALNIETEDKRSILGDIAAEAQDFEFRLAEMIQRFATGAAGEVTAPSIRYPTEFDLRSFQSEVDDALQLKKFKLSPEVDLEMVQDLVRKKFSGMDPKRLKELTDSLKVQQEADEAAAKKAAAMGPPSPGDGGGDGEDGAQGNGVGKQGAGDDAADDDAEDAGTGRAAA